MPRKFQGIAVAVACMLGWTPAGAAALDHVSRPMDANVDFVMKVAAKKGCPYADGCGASTLAPQARNIGSFVKSQPFGQWTGTARDLVAVSKQAPPIAIAPEDASAHIERMTPVLEKEGFKVEQFHFGEPMVRITAPPL